MNYLKLDRPAYFTKGPRFFLDSGKLMFENVIDASNRIGPRIASELDKVKFEQAYQDFVKLEDGASPPTPKKGK